MAEPNLPPIRSDAGRATWARIDFLKRLSLLITADAGGRNDHRARLWKVSFQVLADELNRMFHVCYFHLALATWNKIEHRFVSFITQEWSGIPLASLHAIVSLIASTKTGNVLIVNGDVDINSKPTSRTLTKN
jgi:hypothetical protein